jgi:hypothetical protein
VAESTWAPVPARDVLAFFLQQGQKRDHDTLVMMAYLADWKTCLEGNPRLLDVAWTLGSFGPSAPEVHDALDDVTRFEQLPEGGIRLLGVPPVIPSNMKPFLEHVENTTKDLRRDKLTQLVYSTFPVMHTDRFAPIDLERAATSYREFKTLRDARKEDS